MGREKEKRRKSEAQLASECERGSPADDDKRHLGTCSSWQGSVGGATSGEWGSATRVRRSRTSKTRLDLQRGWGEYGEVTYTNSPDCLLNRGSFRSFGYASLVRTLPSLSRKGSALDPPGNQSEMTLAVIGWTPALAYAR